MTGALAELPWGELDRTHRQALVGLRHAVSSGDGRAHKSSARLERRCRIEKIRRAGRRRP